MIGRLLTERYLILRNLSSGGFSETYLARDKYLPHHPLCVVKCLKSLLGDATRQLFETEAQILLELGRQCQQLPQLLAYVEEGEQIHLVQEYVEGNSLEQSLEQRQAFSQKEAIKVLMETLQILDFLHSQKVVHQDIKPGNLIQRSDGKIILIDFGAAKKNSSNSQAVEVAQIMSESSTEILITIGTPGYMPEEQQQGRSNFSSDLYALGISIVHLLTGVHPQQFQKDIVSGGINWQCYLKKPLNSHLISILNKMVRVNHQDRYQKAGEVLHDLEQLRLSSYPQKQGVSLQPLCLSLFPLELKTIGIASLLILGSFAYVWQLSSQVGQVEKVFALIQPSEPAKLKLRHDLPLEPPIDLETLTAVALSPDGNWLVTSKDQSIQLWNLRLGRLFKTLEWPYAQVTAAIFSPDAQTIAMASEDQSVRTWNVRTGKETKVLTDLEAPITALVYAPDHSTIICAVGDRIEVWNLQTGELQQVFTGHQGRISHLLVSANGNTLYSLGDDRTIAWNLNSEKLVQAFPQASGMAMSASLGEQYLATVHLGEESVGEMRIWDLKTGVLVRKIPKNLELNSETILCVDRYLISSDSEQRLKVWEILMVGP